LFKVLTGVDIVHVPYKGGGPSMLAVIAGEAQLMFSSIVQTVSNIQAGGLRPLATGGAQRSPILPDLPTIAEAGVPEYVAADWWGILAPAGTPAPIVAKLHGAIEDVLRSADTMKNLDQQGATPLHMSSAEFGAYIQAEMAKWGPVVKKAGMKAEQAAASGAEKIRSNGAFRGIVMRGRKFIAGVAGAAPFPLAAFAQQPQGMRRIGV